MSKQNQNTAVANANDDDMAIPESALQIVRQEPKLRKELMVHKFIIGEMPDNTMTPQAFAEKFGKTRSIYRDYDANEYSKQEAGEQAEQLLLSMIEKGLVRWTELRCSASWVGTSVKRAPQAAK